MIDAIDHVVLGAKDLEAATGAYQTLLAVAPAWRTPASGGGAEVAMFAFPNLALEIMAPTPVDPAAGEGATGARLRATLEREGEGLKSLVFHTPDMARLTRRWGQVGLAPEPVAAGESLDALSGRARAWTRTRSGATPGVRVFAIASETPLPLSGLCADSPVTGIDHIVVRTANPDRALAFYGAQLGLDLRMDRTFGEIGARLLFFRVGDAILEIAHRAGDEPDPAAPDRLWGLTWRVADAVAAQARLARAGLDVSEVRPGLKPGTQVFTVRDGTCGVPTLLLQPAPRGSA